MTQKNSMTNNGRHNTAQKTKIEKHEPTKKWGWTHVLRKCSCSTSGIRRVTLVF